ncbi:fimbrial chaperone [Salmonella enterica subsp. enterica serovar Stanleyville]|uniref:Fimbrial chaperone n=1 Tax=Salmonella enterica I TaxID=59201 RepID=A0A3Z7IDE3_SALET|nr:fimbrial chaperone [Salmonella enterica subsp. enterica serovar Stanleyville]EAB9004877.1 fimbrial chaperone [Salmonella enterica subsp. enterica serovar Ajiobo]EAC1005485.1 fimbrial chaperone [Salmonella enterica subsp. enterica]EAM3049903.1 fimbrial chaperone [Salmonella enterica]ECY4211633.1 fimbrial chaperone [Salmonella enterica subsp. enterica serovar Typhimurium]EIL1352096.1 fimbrial chaperone [Salmonella enterica subsp. enterica serovar Enteritidis]
MTRMCRSLFPIVSAIAVLSVIQPAQADIVLSGTRVVYKAAQQNTTIRLENKGSTPALVQSWLDDGDSNADPSTINVPFNATPPVSRIEPGRGQTVTLTYTGSSALPKDRESIYWFNVLEVPPKMKDAEVKDKNVLQLAFRTRIKLFYRPDGLDGTASDAPQKLQWRMQQKAGKAVVHVTNPTGYYVSFNKVEAVVGGRKYAVSSSMVAPKGESDFTISGLTGTPAKTSISYIAISDFGGAINGKVDI